MILLLMLACEKEPNPAPTNEAFCALVESVEATDAGDVVALDCEGRDPYAGLDLIEASL